MRSALQRSLHKKPGSKSGSRAATTLNMIASSFLGFAAAYAAATLAAPTPSAVSPTVQLDNGTFVGTSDGTTDSFLGIKFADAPYVGFRSLVDVY